MDYTPRELGAAEVTAVKDNAPKVEDQALPGHRRVIFEMRRDDPNNGLADFAAGLERKSSLRRSFLARIRLVWLRK